MTVIFAAGSRRSGTSVLYRLLCAGERSNGLLPEAGYLRAPVQAYAMAVKDFKHDASGFFRDQDDLHAFTPA